MKLESENSILIQEVARIKAVLSEKTSQMLVIIKFYLILFN